MKTALEVVQEILDTHEDQTVAGLHFCEPCSDNFIHNSENWVEYPCPEVVLAFALKAVLELHVSNQEFLECCIECGSPFPCDTDAVAEKVLTTWSIA